MESHDLRIFHAVAVEGSITRAAEKLGYVQSNITARVRQLEAELNTKLFYRHSRGMTLTAPGKNLLSYAEKILYMLEEAHNFVNQSMDPSGPLALGSCQTAAAVYVPKVLAEYHREYPLVDLSLVTDHSDMLIQRVQHFELDGAFVSAPVRNSEIVEEVIFEEELVLAAKPSETGLPDILRLPILMNSTGCLYRAQIEGWMNAQGISNPRIMEFYTMDAILGGIMAGLGVSLIPRSAIEKLEEAGLIRTFPISNEYKSVTTAFIRHRDSLMTSAMTEFINVLKKHPTMFSVFSEDLPGAFYSGSTANSMAAIRRRMDNSST